MKAASYETVSSTPRRRTRWTNLLRTALELRDPRLLLPQVPLRDIDLGLQLGALPRELLLLPLKHLHLASLRKLLVPPPLNIPDLLLHRLDLPVHPPSRSRSSLHLALALLHNLDALELARGQLRPVPCDDELGESLELRRLLLEFEERALLLSKLVELGRDLVAKELCADMNQQS